VDFGWEFMEEELKNIYEGFGYDFSKGLRSLNQISDEEAINVAKIFMNKLSWEVSSREKDKIELKSGPFPMIIHRSFGNGSYTKDTHETIYLHADGNIQGPVFASKKHYSFVDQYLLSIGVERPLLTKEKLEEILRE